MTGIVENNERVKRDVEKVKTGIEKGFYVIKDVIDM